MINHLGTYIAQSSSWFVDCKDDEMVKCVTFVSTTDRQTSQILLLLDHHISANSELNRHWEYYDILDFYNI